MVLATSDIARQVDEAFLWIGSISLFLLIGVTLTMLWFVWRYHRRRNRRPAQIEGHLGLELTWIVIPTILVMIMFYKGYQGFALMRDFPPGAMEVDVIGQKWVWVFSYPQEKIVTERLHLPVNRPVKFNLTAKEGDVNHSFYLPAFRVKEDCVPGRTTHLWIQPEEIGVYNIFCAEFCGKDHAKMITELEVMAPADYERWVKEKRAERFKPVDMKVAVNPQAGEIKARKVARIYKTYCASCHGPSGRGGLVEGARDFTAPKGWRKGARITDIYRTLETGIKGTQMRSFKHLPPWDRFALAHRIRSFLPPDKLPADDGAALEKLNEEFKLDQIKPPRELLSIEAAMKIMATPK